MGWRGKFGWGGAEQTGFLRVFFLASRGHFEEGVTFVAGLEREEYMGLFWGNKQETEGGIHFLEKEKQKEVSLSLRGVSKIREGYFQSGRGRS